MKLRHRMASRLTLLMLAACSQLVASPVSAQAYPVRAIKIVVPYGTGGGSDILARQIGARLQTIWGQGVVVDNRAGASGNIGTEAVVRSPADGYTLLLQNSTMVVNPAVTGKLNYDPEKDLTPIALAAHQSTNIAHEFPEHIDKMRALKTSSKHFASLFSQYDEDNHAIAKYELGDGAISDDGLEELKKRRMKTKDEIYAMLKAG